MRSRNTQLRQLYSMTLAATLGLGVVIAMPSASFAGGCDGLNLFSGVERDKQLACRLDFGGNIGATDRYRFRIAKKKMKYAVNEFTIDYSDHFNGSFDAKNVDIIVNGKEKKAQDVIWDEENKFIKVIPTEAIPAGSDVEIHFNNVQNPNRNGMFYFNCRVQTPGDIPLLRDLGTWIVEIQ